MLLLIDNYDSFTHNLSRYFQELGEQVVVVRNDELDCRDIARMAPKRLVFSPGPGNPDQAGVTLAAIETFAGQIPMLGVCLGHQAIGQVFGADVVQAQNIKHGKTSNVLHDGSQLFEGVPSPFVATRYHSLLLDNRSVSADFAVTAWCEEEGSLEIMAIEHQRLPIMGVQFHPESVLTVCGHQILANFLAASAE
ncbi:aminodeoxychorismate/anthranilate synthase component II [Aestuariibacter halophilus]|uniref:Aminodeoxychorismate/anthranilate synthase component II n=1 Tax=Fluctibacter halophilus TaxID=226011 RepID=A0ABS8GBF0_9ALTE|nr:aminodeoxychorismate/anthranilate synthase component II [Aestuariibacter halophilus]MCC2617391.1 aminodeoxychorismate/anthranilate synthase component II [Aestuariibacter halophilus]